MKTKQAIQTRFAQSPQISAAIFTHTRKRQFIFIIASVLQQH